jgi:hypothetical protein
MKIFSLILVFILLTVKGFSQENALYQTGLTAEQNLNAIGSLAKFSTGGVGFDTRYEGVKGSPELFEKLMPSLMRVKGQNYYIQLETSLDIVKNSLIFKDPKTGKMLLIPSDVVKEVKISIEGKELTYRVSRERYFEREIKDGRFYQVLKEGSFVFIKLPFKKLIAADYKDVYSPDRRYDEYTTYYKYYIMQSDSIFHQVQLTRRSILKEFPGKKEIINKPLDEKSFNNNEEMVLEILNRL